MRMEKFVPYEKLSKKKKKEQNDKKRVVWGLTPRPLANLKIRKRMTEIRKRNIHYRRCENGNQTSGCRWSGITH